MLKVLEIIAQIVTVVGLIVAGYYVSKSLAVPKEFREADKR